jgi:hypothetical protein
MCGIVSAAEAEVIQVQLVMLSLKPRDALPFRDPHYWAGFVCWGLG